MVWWNRHAITGAILHGREMHEATWIMRAGAGLWAPLVSIYFVAAWVEEAVRRVMGDDAGVPLLAGAFLTLLLALVVQATGFYVVERTFGRSRTLARARAEAAARVPVDAPGPDPAIGEVPAPLPDPSLQSAGVASPLASRADAADADGDEEGGGGPPSAHRAPDRPPPVAGHAEL